MPCVRDGRRLVQHAFRYGNALPTSNLCSLEMANLTLAGVEADMVACSVGAEYGWCSRLNLCQLEAVVSEVRGLLVLCGGSGIGLSDLAHAAGLGCLSARPCIGALYCGSMCPCIKLATCRLPFARGRGPAAGAGDPPGGSLQAPPPRAGPPPASPGTWASTAPPFTKTSGGGWRKAWTACGARPSWTPAMSAFLREAFGDGVPMEKDPRRRSGRGLRPPWRRRKRGAKGVLPRRERVWPLPPSHLRLSGSTRWRTWGGWGPAGGCAGWCFWTTRLFTGPGPLGRRRRGGGRGGSRWPTCHDTASICTLWRRSGGAMGAWRS